MANEDLLAKLKKGAELWNKWRAKNSSFDIDLSGANLRKVQLMNYNLSGANLAGADFSDADLSKANLTGSNLIGANLLTANLTSANLQRVTMMGTDLRFANLERAYLVRAEAPNTDFQGANLLEANLNAADLTRSKLNFATLTETNLRGTHLNDADLSSAKLREADLTGAFLRGSNFSEAVLANTNFGDLDLSEVIGLEEVIHSGPSPILMTLLVRSKGKIPEVFLRGCGLSDWEIEMVKLYNPDISNEERNKVLYRIYDLQATQAIQISPLFISYSHKNSEFVDKVGNWLNKRGIRYWRDVHDMKAGRIEKQIDRAIRQNPTVLLVLSDNSLSSDWVEHEVRTARGLEKEMGRDVLCPVALDDSWKESRWPKRVMEQIMEYNILDFSAWKDDNNFEGMFRKLIDGLELFYKG